MLDLVEKAIAVRVQKPGASYGNANLVGLGALIGNTCSINQQPSSYQTTFV